MAATASPPTVPRDRRRPPAPPLTAQSCRPLGHVRRESVLVVAAAEALDAILDFSQRDLGRETGGFLMGTVHDRPRPTVVVRKFLPARAGRGTAASLTFTAETWAALRTDQAETCPELELVGWHHTHPGLGVFFSGYDRFIHKHFFGRPHQIATVADPVAEELVMFQWHAGAIVDGGLVVYQADPAGAL